MEYYSHLLLFTVCCTSVLVLLFGVLGKKLRGFLKSLLNQQKSLIQFTIPNKESWENLFTPWNSL